MKLIQLCFLALSMSTNSSELYSFAYTLFQSIGQKVGYTMDYQRCSELKMRLE